MIRINLLPTKAVVRVTSARTQLIIAGVVILLSLIGPFLWAHSLNSRISELDGEIAKKKLELKKVEQARKKLEAIKKLNEDLKRKLEVISNIEKARVGPVWLMDQMTDAVSRFAIKNRKTGKVTWRYMDDRIFLRKMVVKGNALEIEGVAINNTYLVAFLNNLKSKSDLFQNVHLYYSDEEYHAGSRVRKFKITATIILSAKPRTGGPASETTPEETSDEGAEAEQAQNAPAPSGGR